MYHERFTGSHYEIGYRWGSLLAKHGKFILDQIPFSVTKERIAYAEASIPVYQAYFPEILEEIQGIADGQGTKNELFRAVLISMYSMPPEEHCSCFAVSNGEAIILGRNSDFLTELEEKNMNVIYRLSSDSYDFTGNTTAFVEMEDGVNEKGLAVGLTSVYPIRIQPGMNAGMLLRFFLERCCTVDEVIQWTKRLPIGSAQTFTVADAKGKIALIECCADGIGVVCPQDEHSFVCATNRFHTKELEQHNKSGVDDWFAETRYQTMKKTLEEKSKSMDLSGAERLLSGKDGFICQYDRKTGLDTVWSVVYDLANHSIYRTEGNPSRWQYKADKRFLF